MVKILHRKKYFVVLLCIFSILLLFISIFIYRNMSRNVIKAEIVNISIEKSEIYYDYDMSESKKEELNNNLDDFAYVRYRFDIKNSAKDIEVSGINIQPIFSKNMNENVYWYAGTDAITDSEEALGAEKEKNMSRRVLIKKNGLTNEEIINMAEKDNFKIKYKTFKRGSLLSYGYNWLYVKNKAN